MRCVTCGLGEPWEEAAAGMQSWERSDCAAGAAGRRGQRKGQETRSYPHEPQGYADVCYYHLGGSSVSQGDNPDQPSNSLFVCFRG